MGKIWFSTWLVIILCSCAHKQETDDLEKIFTLSKKVEIEDDVLITGSTTRAVFLSDSSILLNDFISRTLVKLNIHTGRSEKIGKNGNGPGEYIIPFYFEANENNILVSDFDKVVIEQINLNGNALKTYQSKHHFLNGTKFTSKNDKLFVLNDASTDYYLRNDSLEFFKVPRCFKYDYPVKSPTGIARSENLLFFMNLYEAKVYGFEFDTKREFSINLEHNKAGVWERFYEKELDPLKIENILDKRLFSGFDIYEHKNKSMFLVMETDLRFKENYLHLYHTNGTKNISVNLKNKKYLANKNNEFLFLERDDKSGMVSFSIYRFDQSKFLIKQSRKDNV